MEQKCDRNEMGRNLNVLFTTFHMRFKKKITTLNRSTHVDFSSGSYLDIKPPIMLQSHRENKKGKKRQFEPKLYFKKVFFLIKNEVWKLVKSEITK